MPRKKKVINLKEDMEVHTGVTDANDVEWHFKHAPKPDDIMYWFLQRRYLTKNLVTPYQFEYNFLRPKKKVSELIKKMGNGAETIWIKRICDVDEGTMFYATDNAGRFVDVTQHLTKYFDILDLETAPAI